MTNENGIRVQYVVYNDGHECCRFDIEEDAINAVKLYDGDHQVWYEEEEVIDEE